MTATELAQWRADLSLSQRAAAAALGVTLATYQSWERGSIWASGKGFSIDRRTALACAAISAGLPPFGEPTASKSATVERQAP